MGSGQGGSGCGCLQGCQEPTSLFPAGPLTSRCATVQAQEGGGTHTLGRHKGLNNLPEGCLIPAGELEAAICKSTGMIQPECLQGPLLLHTAGRGLQGTPDPVEQFAPFSECDQLKAPLHGYTDSSVKPVMCGGRKRMGHLKQRIGVVCSSHAGNNFLGFTAGSTIRSGLLIPPGLQAPSLAPPPEDQRRHPQMHLLHGRVNGFPVASALSAARQVKPSRASGAHKDRLIIKIMP